MTARRSTSEQLAETILDLHAAVGEYAVMSAKLIARHGAQAEIDIDGFYSFFVDRGMRRKNDDEER